MSALLTTFLVLALSSSVLSALTHFAVLKALRRRPAVGGASATAPPISVLKPLKGSEPDLYDNLASFARQDYPNFELVLGAEAEDDPALGVALRVARDFPHVTIRVGNGSDDVGLNPKVRILKVLSERARHDLVLVSDACIHAHASYLRAMAAELGAPNVGLVSSVLVGCGERTLGARLDNLHMNSFIARGVCGGAELARHPCVIGKSMLLRKSELAKLGGFSLVEDVLAEDYVLGQRFAGAAIAWSCRRIAWPRSAANARWASFSRATFAGVKCDDSWRPRSISWSHSCCRCRGSFRWRCSCRSRRSGPSGPGSRLFPLPGAERPAPAPT